MARVRAVNQPLPFKTIVGSSLVEFDDQGFADVTDPEILRVLQEVGEATGSFVVEGQEDSSANAEEKKTRRSSKKEAAATE